MINFEDRLKSLKNRRQGLGLDLGVRLSTASALPDLESREIITENYENLKESSSIKYTIGAMAPVEKKSTDISISEGERVANSLIKSLKEQGVIATSRLQGSVALDIHIKGHSDVDMLIIEGKTSQSQMPRVHDNYTPATDKRDMVDIVKDLRLKSENILPENFPRTNINNDGNKSIALEGGSLKRKVDIVPASWYNTRTYQYTNDESDRGINIYHKADHKLILNLPFTHIKLISDKDDLYSGNLRSSIRLMKNLIADMPEYKKRIVKKLSSYDLASIAYHMDENLNLTYELRLGLVEKIRAHLNILLHDSYKRDSLEVPDGSRKIFDNDDKINALEILENEFSDLAKAILKDLNPYILEYNSSYILDKRVA